MKCQASRRCGQVAFTFEGELKRRPWPAAAACASAAVPCREESPVLSNIQQIAGPQKMQVVAVNIEDRKVYRKLESALKDDGLTPAYDPDQQVRKAYGVHGVPHRVIVAVRIGYAKTALDGLAEDLNRALAAPVEPAAQ